MEAASVESNKRKRPAVQRERLAFFFFAAGAGLKGKPLSAR
jgi:hypothetical protein